MIKNKGNIVGALTKEQSKYNNDFCDLKPVALKNNIPVKYFGNINNNYKLIEQDEKLANSWRKRFRKDGIIDWRMSTDAILNLIKALTKPYSGVEFQYNNQNIIVWEAERYEYNDYYQNIESGKVLKIVDGLPVIKCYDGLIKLIMNYMLL